MADEIKVPAWLATVPRRWISVREIENLGATAVTSEWVKLSDVAEALKSGKAVPDYLTDDVVIHELRKDLADKRRQLAQVTRERDEQFKRYDQAAAERDQAEELLEGTRDGLKMAEARLARVHNLVTDEHNFVVGIREDYIRVTDLEEVLQ